MIFDKWRCSSCMKSVRIRSYYGPYFPAFGLNTKRYSVSLRIQSEYGKIRTRITPNTLTFHAVTDLGKLTVNTLYCSVKLVIESLPRSVCPVFSLFLVFYYYFNHLQIRKIRRQNLRKL